MNVVYLLGKQYPHNKSASRPSHLQVKMLHDRYFQYFGLRAQDSMLWVCCIRFSSLVFWNSYKSYVRSKVVNKSYSCLKIKLNAQWRWKRGGAQFNTGLNFVLDEIVKVVAEFPFKIVKTHGTPLSVMIFSFHTQFLSSSNNV